MNYLKIALVLLAVPVGRPATALQAPAEVAHVESKEAASAAPLLSKVRLMGASVTAGFGNADELKTGRNVPLTTFFQACLAEKNAGIDLNGKGSNAFFGAPQLTGAQQAARARAANPTLVIALDYLFWYGAGVNSDKKPRRMKGIEMGLKELEAFTCPLVIGTIPNVRHALQGKSPFGGPIISPWQIPSDEERLAMNLRIREWAAVREQVKVVDLERFFFSIVQSEPIKMRGQTWTISSMASVLQGDLLHPNLDGTVMTAIAVADKVAELEGASADDFVFEPAKVREHLLALLGPARAKHADRLEKAALRKAKREKASQGK